MKHTVARLHLLLAAALALPLLFAATPASAQNGDLCFSETGQCISGRFREYWEQNGGLAVFGFPITPVVDEYNADLQRNVPTQWFERNRFELHPQNQRPYDVLLGRLSVERLRDMDIAWQGFPAGTQQPGCLWFAETQHSVCDQAAGLGFKSYWQNHGLQFDGRPGYSYAESLALFGLPISEPMMETNSSGDTVLTQWFERARFEWHPNQSDQYKVLLGLLGNEMRARLVRSQNPGLLGRLLVAGNDTLYSVKADGSSIDRLPLDPQRTGVVIAPRQGKVALRCSANGATGLCVSNLNGSNRVRINSDPNISNLSWSPDATRIAYVSGSEDRRGLHVVNVDGSSDVLVMAGTPGLMQGIASWSPDGRQITFNTVFSEHAIYVANADGSQLRRIAPSGDMPQWSPMGLRIVYEHAGDIHAISADGSGYQQITSGGDYESAPQWSPDGSRIAYRWAGQVEPNPLGGPSGVYVVRADGTNPIRALYTDPTYSFFLPAWSPDSQYIAATRGCPRLCGPQQIWGAKADGSQQFLMIEGADSTAGAALFDWLP